MFKKNVVVRLDPGIQARNAAKFVQKAIQYSSNIYLEKDLRKVNAKSIMGVMSLAVSQGEEIILSADGEDAKKAVNELIQFVENESA